MNFDYKENGEKKSISCKTPSINIVYPNMENMTVVPNHKKNGDYYEDPSLTHLTTNFDYTDNGGKKTFSCQAIATISCILIRRT